MATANLWKRGEIEIEAEQRPKLNNLPKDKATEKISPQVADNRGGYKNGFRKKDSPSGTAIHTTLGQRTE